MAHWLHLAGRTWRSLAKPTIDKDQLAWLMALLNPRERLLFRTMSAHDRKHGLDCALRVEQYFKDLDGADDPGLASAGGAGLDGAGLGGADGAGLGGCTQSEIVVAAALHDVGKTASGLSTFARIAATLVIKIFPAALEGRAGDNGLLGQFARYQQHPRIGSEMLSEAGSSDLVVTWALEHHLHISQMTIETQIAQLLQTVDH